MFQQSVMSKLFIICIKTADENLTKLNVCLVIRLSKKLNGSHASRLDCLWWS